MWTSIKSLRRNLAQLVECLFYTETVSGSTPLIPRLSCKEIKDSKQASKAANREIKKDVKHSQKRVYIEVNKGRKNSNHFKRDGGTTVLGVSKKSRV